jgi:hypothetical protein
MAPTRLRFRDSLPLRIGLGIIAVLIALAVAELVALRIDGYNPPAGPSGIWAFFWLILGIGFVIVGIGQTIVRRRKERDSR